MNLITTINGQRLTPLRAAPFLTDGVFDVVCVANMLADPESYCDHENSTVLEAYRIDDYGRMIYIPQAGFESLAMCERTMDRDEAREIKDFTLAPSGILIKADNLKEIFNMLMQHPKIWENRSNNLIPPIWREEIKLNEKVKSRVIEGLESSFYRVRKNARETTHLMIESAFRKIEERANFKNINLDRKALPGVKIEFAQLIQKIEPKLAYLSEVTLIDYAREIGFAWLSGSRPNSPDNLKKIYFSP